MFKLTRLSFTFVALTLSAVVHADVELDLGTPQRVTQLFAYPNNCSVICFRPLTLEQIIPGPPPEELAGAVGAMTFAEGVVKDYLADQVKSRETPGAVAAAAAASQCPRFAGRVG